MEYGYPQEKMIAAEVAAEAAEVYVYEAVGQGSCHHGWLTARAAADLVGRDYRPARGKRDPLGRLVVRIGY